MRRSVLHSLLLLVAFASVVLAQSTSSSASSTIVVPGSTSAPVSKSPCEICRDTGDCFEASDGSPGHFCRDWTFLSDKIACCCATGEECSVAGRGNVCVCKPKDSGSNYSFWVFAIGGLFIIAVCCAVSLALIRFFRRRRMQAPPAVIIQQPVYIREAYPQQGFAVGTNGPPVYSQPGDGRRDSRPTW